MAQPTLTPANVLFLQRQLGNQAVLRLLNRDRMPTAGRPAPPTVQRGPLDKLKAFKAAREEQWGKTRGGGLRDAAQQGDPAKLDTTGKGRDASSVTSDIYTGAGSAAALAEKTSGVADSTLLTLSTTPKSYGTGEKIVIAGSENMAGELNAASAGVGAGTASLAGLGNFLGLVESIRVATDKKKTARERTKGGIEAAENVAQGGISAAQFAGGGVGSVTGMIGASAMGDISTGAVELLGGFGEGIAQLFATGKGLVNLVWDIVQAAKHKKKWGDVLKENLGAMLGGLVPALKRFLGLSKSILSGVRWILKAVEVGGEFVQAFPLIGNSIGIFLKLLSILEETVKIVVEAVRISKAGWYIHKLHKMGAMALQTAGDVVRINKKRVKRHLLPVLTNTGRILSDLLGISGNVLQIVGVATSAAYGAGVGLMAGGIAAGAAGTVGKIGMSGIEVGAKGWRWAKQAGRDIAAAKEGKDKAKGGERGRFGKAMSSVFDTTKSTAQKDAKYKQDAQTILTNLAALPHIKGTPEEQSVIVADHYRPMLALLKATGVSLKELQRQESLEKMQEKLVEAMKSR
ncbi:MAG: hypothetical protein R3300_15430 [Candidatus Promineifilaceae bacterium]|nr:hypothetical protein [Candidatus Promineifilaceae bacterium]